MAKPARPTLRYHGGKWMLAPWIISHLPQHRIYVEPFGGAASVLLRKPPAYSEVYNDLDGEVVNLFQVLRDSIQSKMLVRALYLTPYARHEFDLSYESCDDPVEMARRTVFRSFAGFSSAANGQYKTGFRSNSNRSGTAPAHDWANYPECLQVVIERLRGVVIENKDAFSVIELHDSPETVFYCDPPYVHSTRCQRSSVGAYRYELSDDDHSRLSDLLKSVQGMVVLSGYPCELYDRLYADWRCIQKTARADGARERVECLWLSPNISERQAGLFEWGAA